MESQKTTNGEQQNIIKVEKLIAKDKTQYTIEYQMSDNAFQQFRQFDSKIQNVPVQQMELLQKQLDKPLKWFSKLGASIFAVKTKHQFLLFQTGKFLMTIDFYQGDRIKVRIGDKINVLQQNKSHARKHAEIVKSTDGLEWKRFFKQGQLFVKDILDFLKHKKLQRSHSKISFNGSHFSRSLWNDLTKIADKRK